MVCIKTHTKRVEEEINAEKYTSRVPIVLGNRLLVVSVVDKYDDIKYVLRICHTLVRLKVEVS